MVHNYLKRTGNREIDRVIFHKHPFRTHNRIVFQSPTSRWNIVPLDDRPMRVILGNRDYVGNCLDFYRVVAPDILEQKELRDRNRQELQDLINDSLGITKIVFGGDGDEAAARAAGMVQGQYFACTWRQDKQIYCTYQLLGVSIDSWTEVYMETRQALSDGDVKVLASLSQMIWNPWIVQINFDPDRVITRCSECRRPITIRSMIEAGEDWLDRAAKLQDLRDGYDSLIWCGKC